MENDPKHNRLKLMKVVKEHIESQNWNEGRKEWIASYIGTGDETCICGKRHIKDLYMITHKTKPNLELYPVGSSCILQFEDEDMEIVVKNQQKEVRRLKRIKTKQEAITGVKDCPFCLKKVCDDCKDKLNEYYITLMHNRAFRVKGVFISYDDVFRNRKLSAWCIEKKVGGCLLDYLLYRYGIDRSNLLQP